MGPPGAGGQWRSQAGDSGIGQLPQIWLQQVIINLPMLVAFRECLFVAQLLRLLWDNYGCAPGTRWLQISSLYLHSGTQAKEADPVCNITVRVWEPNNTIYIHHFHSFQDEIAEPQKEINSEAQTTSLPFKKHQQTSWPRSHCEKSYPHTKQDGGTLKQNTFSCHSKQYII